MGLSLAQRVALLPSDARDQWIDALPEELLEEVIRGEWWWVARPEQIPPEGDWLVALALAGRGWGKSRAGAEWLTEQILKHPFDAHGQPTEWLLIAETLADTRTICLEGPAGMLRVLNRRGVDYRYKQSPRPMILFPDGAKVYAEGADDADVGRGYNASGAWVDEICVAEGEMIATDHGDVPIEHVKVGDRVLTRVGYRLVTAAAMTSPKAEVMGLITHAGIVRLTPNHRVWVEGQGWTLAKHVALGDIMLTCLPQVNQSQVTPPPSTTGMENDGSSTRRLSTTTTDQAPCSTEVSGSRSTDLSQTALRSTTLTESDGTTAWQTLNYSPSLIIDGSPLSNEPMLPGMRGVRSAPVRDFSGTGNSDSRDLSSVSNVDVSTSALECAPNTAPRSAAMPSPAGIRPTRVLGVGRVFAPTHVYDLTVEGAEEFFAGGLLVHNCKWPKSYESWYEGILPSLRTDLLNDHPRCFATTTPKPVKLLQEWMKRDDGTIHLMGGSTFDNATNLSQHVLRELKLRYKGTALGEQELYGKMLELAGGGLFKRMDIVNNRVTELPDNITATVVGVDPNLTGEDASTGIVVVSRSADNHLWVRGDRTVPDAGRAAALAMWRAVAEFAADMMVYEENLGKRYMQEVLRDAYFESCELGLFPKGTTPPMKGIHAKHGKKTRAEPVAMRNEQGRLHMVGEHSLLEDQMIIFDPESSRESPDRMDALVHACLDLMAGEKRRMNVSDPSRYDFRLDQGMYDLGKLL